MRRLASTMTALAALTVLTACSGDSVEPTRHGVKPLQTFEGTGYLVARSDFDESEELDDAPPADVTPFDGYHQAVDNLVGPLRFEGVDVPQFSSADLDAWALDWCERLRAGESAHEVRADAEAKAGTEAAPHVFGSALGAVCPDQSRHAAPDTVYAVE